MSSLFLKAFAKINLTLDVLQKRPDGYHNLKMIMHQISLCDDIKLTLLSKPEFSLRSSYDFLPKNENNLALAAARLYLERTGRKNMGVHINLTKRIPVSAGLGGGSADAAVVLSGLNKHFNNEVPKEKLFEWGMELGSDIPFCLLGGTAMAEGRGEILTPLTALPPCHIALCRPDMPVSTKSAFAELNVRRISRRPDNAGMVAALLEGSLKGVSQRLFNVFEDTLFSKNRSIADIRKAFIENGALGACMSGSGAAMYGIFDNLENARKACLSLKSDFNDIFLV